MESWATTAPYYKATQFTMLDGDTARIGKYVIIQNNDKGSHPVTVSF